MSTLPRRSRGRQTSGAEITRALGGRWHGRYGMACCPCHDDRTPSLKIKDDESKCDGVDVVCFAGCDWRDVKADLVRQGLLPGFAPAAPRRAPPPDDTEERVAAALKIWKASKPLLPATSSKAEPIPTLGWRYFTERRQLPIGLLDELDHALRWREGIGAVVALMSDPVTGEATGVHRTFVNSDGTKRDRRMLGKQGVIRLAAPTKRLGITEGVEDALAVRLSGFSPVWAATSAGAVERFPLIPGVETLVVFADRDEVGQRAAEQAVERYRSAGRYAVLRLPSSGCKDWAEWFSERMAA